jgi:hypothetical protein
VPKGIELDVEVDEWQQKGACLCVPILLLMMGYKLIVERPTVTDTRARGTNGPTESATLAAVSVMVDLMMGLIWGRP